MSERGLGIPADGRRIKPDRNHGCAFSQSCLHAWAEWPRAAVYCRHCLRRQLIEPPSVPSEQREAAMPRAGP
jgi:hypothetical protein